MIANWYAFQVAILSVCLRQLYVIAQRKHARQRAETFSFWPTGIATANLMGWTRQTRLDAAEVFLAQEDELRRVSSIQENMLYAVRYVNRIITFLHFRGPKIRI